ncbi:hypothetical protein ACHAWF_009931 [Thalassiosira exigua]
MKDGGSKNAGNVEDEVEYEDDGEEEGEGEEESEDDESDDSEDDEHEAGTEVDRGNYVGVGASMAQKTYDLATDCATSNYPRLVHDRETWEFLQRSYLRSGGRFPYRPGDWDETSTSDDRPVHGFVVKFDVRDDGHRGRSVYAAQPIPEGARVYNGYHMASFHSRDGLEAFLRLLPRDLQCDVFLWAYPGEGDRAWVALDAASYTNHGETEDVRNLDEECETTRDVEAGEEFLQDYDAYQDHGEASKWFNEARDRAWREADADEGGSTRAAAGDDVERYNQVGAPKRPYGGRSNERTIPRSFVTFAPLVPAICTVAAVAMYGCRGRGLLHQQRKEKNP